MDKNTQRCPNCAGQLGMDGNKKICPYCGAEFEIDVEKEKTQTEIPVQNETPLSEVIQQPKDIHYEITVDEIAELCNSLTNSFGEDFEFSNKLLKRLKIPSGENVFLTHDDTIFKSGKDGYVITNKGFYCKEALERKTIFTSFSEIYGNADKIEWEDKSSIKLNGKALTCHYIKSSVKVHEEIMRFIQTIAIGIVRC